MLVNPSNNTTSPLCESAQQPIFYPRSLFRRSPCFTRWAPLSACTVHTALTLLPGFAGQDIWHFGNHPIKWVVLTGVLVAYDIPNEVKSPISLVLDDSSGYTLDAIIWRDKAPDMGGVEIGCVLRVKGTLNEFRGVRQMVLSKVRVLKDTDEEVRAWRLVKEFEKILRVPWVISPEVLEKERREEEDVERRRQGVVERRRAQEAAGTVFRQNQTFKVVIPPFSGQGSGAGVPRNLSPPPPPPPQKFVGRRRTEKQGVLAESIQEVPKFVGNKMPKPLEPTPPPAPPVKSGFVGHKRTQSLGAPTAHSGYKRSVNSAEAELKVPELLGTAELDSSYRGHKRVKMMPVRDQGEAPTFVPVEASETLYKAHKRAEEGEEEATPVVVRAETSLSSVYRDHERVKPLPMQDQDEAPTSVVSEIPATRKGHSASVDPGSKRTRPLQSKVQVPAPETLSKGHKPSTNSSKEEVIRITPMVIKAGTSLSSSSYHGHKRTKPLQDPRPPAAIPEKTGPLKPLSTPPQSFTVLIPDRSKRTTNPDDPKKAGKPPSVFLGKRRTAGPPPGSIPLSQVPKELLDSICLTSDEETAAGSAERRRQESEYRGKRRSRPQPQPEAPAAAAATTGKRKTRPSQSQKEDGTYVPSAPSLATQQRRARTRSTQEPRPSAGSLTKKPKPTPTTPAPVFVGKRRTKDQQQDEDEDEERRLLAQIAAAEYVETPTQSTQEVVAYSKYEPTPGPKSGPDETQAPSASASGFRGRRRSTRVEEFSFEFSDYVPTPPPKPAAEDKTGKKGFMGKRRA